MIPSDCHCRFCGNPWEPGGKWHKPDCPIVIGKIIVKLGKKPKREKAAKRAPIVSEWPRVEKLKGF